MKSLIIANWKCNPLTLKGAKFLFKEIEKGIRDIKNIEVVICPPFTQLLAFNNQLLTNLKLGAQNCFWEESGAYTGEVSPVMLKDLGCQYVIIGHSERRALGETDEMINKKIKAVLKEGLKPILCIGEKREERKKRKTFNVLRNQVQENLKRIKNWELEIENLIIAYEPVWAIGTGKPCYPEDAKKVYLFLRKIFKKNQILYGGSVNSKNAKDYIKKAGFQGLLVGGASLDAEEFIKIVKSLN